MMSGIHCKPTAAIVAVAILAFTAPAGADESGFYIGASAGLNLSSELCEGGV